MSVLMLFNFIIIITYSQLTDGGQVLYSSTE